MKTSGECFGHHTRKPQIVTVAETPKQPGANSAAIFPHPVCENAQNAQEKTTW